MFSAHMNWIGNYRIVVFNVLYMKLQMVYDQLLTNVHFVSFSCLSFDRNTDS